MNHLTDLELRNAARERIVAHLAECAECARRYADAIRNRPLEAEPASDVGDFAATGRRFARRRNPWIAPLAAAAVLVIVIAIPLLRRESPRDFHLRSASITTFERDGQLAWISGVAASKYRVEISNGYRADTDQTRLAIPPLKPGKYSWTVTALDANGNPIASSPPQNLTIAK